MFLSMPYNSSSSFRLLLQCGCVWLAVVLASSLAGCSSSPGSRGTVLAADLAGEQKAGLAYRFLPGERMVYQLDYNNTSSSDIRGLFEQQQRAEISGHTQSLNGSVRAEAVATVLGTTSDDALLVYSLRHATVRLSVNDQDLDKQAAIIRAELGGDVFIEVNLQGNVLSLRFDPSVSRASQNFVR